MNKINLKYLKAIEAAERLRVAMEGCIPKKYIQVIYYHTTTHWGCVFTHTAELNLN